MIKYRCIPAGYEREFCDGEWTLNDGVTDYSSIDIEEEPEYDESYNQKINILPDITTGVGLNGEDFDATLTEEEMDCFQEYKEFYKNSSFYTKVGKRSR